MTLSLQEQYDKIFKYCYFKLHNTQLAEDLTQETFLRFFSQNSYISQGKPLAYLYTIARNLCIDAYRKTSLSIPLEDDVSTATNTVENIEIAIVVREAVRTLPLELQEIILLRYTNELSITEISSITGLSRFAVRRKINNAMSQLKLILQKEDFM